MKTKSRSVIDDYIGAQMRKRRLSLNMTQEQLAKALALSVSFQQIQNYENGVNGISAVRLFDICKILNVPLLYMFPPTPRSKTETPSESATPWSGQTISGCGTLRSRPILRRPCDSLQAAKAAFREAWLKFKATAGPEPLASVRDAGQREQQSPRQLNIVSLTSPSVGAVRAAIPAMVARFVLKKCIASSEVIEGIFIEAACLIVPLQISKNTVCKKGSYFGVLANSGDFLCINESYHLRQSAPACRRKLLAQGSNLDRLG
jgi:transcriptional regulator with XRE-family HTH domain